MLKFSEKKTRAVGMKMTEGEYQKLIALGKENKVSAGIMLAAIIRSYLEKK